MTDPNRRRRADEILRAALALPAGRRPSFIAEQSAGDDALAAEVAAMLARMGQPLPPDPPPVDPHDAPTVAPTGMQPRRAPPIPFADPLEEVIGPYKLLSVLGEGGFGIVYLAERRVPHVQRVALKVIKPGMDSKAVIARFEQERQALAVMDHPNVAKVFDAGTTARGRPYFVMEYVQGEAITAYCDRQTLSTRHRLELFIPVCEAVQHAHSKGLIHRDIKPTNVLVSVKDGQPIPKVIDFGVAKAVSHTMTGKSVFTELGQLIGTPEYMSPEQAEMGAIDVDTRTDIYSLGVMLYELLTGAMPFDPKTLRSAGYGEIQRIIREVDPPKPSTRLSAMGDVAAGIAQRRHTQVQSLARELRSELEWIPLKAMRKDRTQRYKTPVEFADDIKNYLAGRPLIAGPLSASYRAKKFVRRHKSGVFAASLVAAALVLGLAGTLWQASRVAAQRDRAVKAEAASTAKTSFLVNTLEAASSLQMGPRATVAAVLERSAPNIDTSFPDQPDVRLALHDTYATVFRSLSLHPQAEVHVRAALLIARQLYGNTDNRTLDLLRRLGTVLMDRGMDSQAAAAFREAGAAVPASDPIALAGRDENIAATLHNAGEYDMAEYRLREALARRKSAAPDAKELAWCMGNLGRLLVDAGFLDDADPLIRQSLPMRRAREGDPSPSTAYGLLFLGYLEQSRRNPEAAAAAYRASRDMCADRLDSNSKAQVAIARMELAGVIEDSGLTTPPAAPESVKPFALDDLEHMRWIAAISLRNRARLLYQLGRAADGDDRFRRSIAVDQELAARGGAADVAGREQSEAHTRRVWADCLRVAARFDEALEQYRLALALQNKALQTNERFIIAPTLIGIGELALARGQAAEAETSLREALARRKSAVDPSAWPIAAAAVPYARALTALGRYAEAEPLLIEALGSLTAAFGPTHPRSRAAREALADLYERWGKPDKAAEYRTNR